MPKWLAAWTLVVLSAYGVVFWVPFFYDDIGHVMENPLVTGPWPGLRIFLTTPFAGAGEYGPLNTAGHWTLHHLVGEWRIPYRLTSLILHLLNCWLLLRLYRRVLGHDSLALAAAVLFSLYPGHAELMALTSFKKHLGVTFFGLLTVHCATDYRIPALWRLLGSWLGLGLGLLCKESALLIPIWALLVHQATARRDGAGLRQDRTLYAALFGTDLLYIAARFFVVPRVLAPLPVAGIVPHILTSAKILLWYLLQLICPWSLCIEHSLLPVRSPWNLEALLVVAALTWVFAITWWLYHRDKILWCGWAWCLLFLIPFLNIVPYLNYSLVANRYLYLSSAGFFLCAARLLQLRAGQGPGVPRLWVVGCIAVGAAYHAMTLSHLGRFTDMFVLWSQAAECAPVNPRARSALGSVLMHRGLYAKAEEELRRALALDPNYPETYLDLAFVASKTGRSKEAILWTKRRLALKSDASGWLTLGVYEMEAGQRHQALTSLRQAAALSPDNSLVRLNLANCLLDLGDLDSAQREFARAARDKTLEAKALRGLGDVNLKRLRPREAQKFYERSLELDPLQGEVVYELARLYLWQGRSHDAARLYDQILLRLKNSWPDLDSARASAPFPELNYAKELYEKIEHNRSRLFPPSHGKTRGP